MGRALAVSIAVAACSTSPAQFGVARATASSSVAVEVVFDDMPDQTEAALATNYTIPGLTVKSASPAGDGTVILATTAQADTPYMLTVANVSRASDGHPIVMTTSQFTGRSPFNLVSASAIDGYTFTVTFDAPPDPVQAVMKGNYSIIYGGENQFSLTSAALTLHGNVVTFSNAAQNPGAMYFVSVSHVARARDGEPLTRASTGFPGIPAAFFAWFATSASVFSATVTFDDVPESTSATTLANYTIPGLTLSGTPTLSGKIVTLTTSAQTDATYTVDVANVTRASNGDPLCGCQADPTFPGTSHCFDSSPDGDETDVDCGGSTCAKCGTSKACLSGADCASGTCNGGPPGTCL
jgi:hypothetical protein